MLNFMRPRTETGPVVAISASDAIIRCTSGDLTVIDVREAAEVSASGKATGALHIPLTLLNFQADPRNPDFHADLDLEKPVALYCASGARSNMAAQMLARLGYTAVHNIGGLGNWINAGGTVEPA